jgi:hypothetical protein
MMEVEQQPLFLKDDPSTWMHQVDDRIMLILLDIQLAGNALPFSLPLLM